MFVNYSEAKDEADHLTKTLNREVKVKRVECDCDYHRNCGHCAGEGRYFINVFVSCGHEISESEYACVEDFCGERELAQRDPFALQPLGSLSEIQSEREEMEYA